MPPAVAVVAAVASAAAGVAGAVNQRKSAKKAERRQAANLAQQKLEAKNEAGLTDVREDTGAEFAFGTSGAADELLKRKSARKGSTSAGASVGKSLSASKIGGL